MKCLSCLKSPCFWVPQRYFFCFYTLLGLNIYFWIRVSVILSLTEMTFPILTQHNDSANQYCPANVKEGKGKDHSKAEFPWSQDMQHLLIQGFYYGYTVSCIPGGMLADTFGGKTVFGCGFLLAAIVSILLPTLAKISPYCFFVGRIVQGLGQGVVFPSMSSLMAKWAPPNERATMSGITSSGIMFGNASAFIVSTLIMTATPTWQEIYYIFGGFGIVYTFGWYLFIYSTPAQHPFISDLEREMIQTLIAQNTKRKPKKIPWKRILTSVPLSAALLANFGHLWASFTMINEMPDYLSKVVNFDIKNSGFFSATPQLSQSITAIGTGYLCDFLVKNGIMSLNVNRKIFIFLSNSLPVPFLIAASFAGCDKVWVVILFAVMMFFKGLAYATLKVQPIDLSPHYAGILMGIMNGSGSIAGFLSPMVVPFFITGDGSLEEWRRFFILSGCIMIAMTLPFLCIGSAQVQPWNSIEEEEVIEEGHKLEEEKEQKPGQENNRSNI